MVRDGYSGSSRCGSQPHASFRYFLDVQTFRLSISRPSGCQLRQEVNISRKSVLMYDVLQEVTSSKINRVFASRDLLRFYQQTNLHVAAFWLIARWKIWTPCGRDIP